MAGRFCDDESLEEWLDRCARIVCLRLTIGAKDIEEAIFLEERVFLDDIAHMDFPADSMDRLRTRVEEIKEETVKYYEDVHSEMCKVIRAESWSSPERGGAPAPLHTGAQSALKRGHSNG